MNGYLALLLTAHVPYVRTAGRQPIGEDLLHETVAYAIIPTLNTLCDLREQRVPLQLALAYSPVLLEQLNDNIVQKHFVIWMEQWLEGVAEELIRCERSGETHRAYLAQFYLNWGQNVLQSFLDRYGRNLVAVLRDLCNDGDIEPL